MANFPRFAQVVQEESLLETSFYKCPKKIKPDFRSIDNCFFLEVLSFLKSMYRRGFLPAENRLKSALQPNGKVWSLCWGLT